MVTPDFNPVSITRAVGSIHMLTPDFNPVSITRAVSSTHMVTLDFNPVSITKAVGSAHMVTPDFNPVKDSNSYRGIGTINNWQKNFTMANSYHQIHLQFVFAVKYRHAVLHKDLRNNVFGVIGKLINENKCKTIIVNGIEDHVHALVGLQPVVSVSELMKAVKSKSSKYINDNHLTPERFEWQEGYGVFSYGQSQVDAVYRYIQNQEEHHKKQTFLDEYRETLTKFDIEYDEQYIFHELL
jgi:putative transposase